MLAPPTFLSRLITGPLSSFDLAIHVTMQLAVNIILFFLGLYLPTIVARRRRQGQKTSWGSLGPDPIRDIIDGLTGRHTSEDGTHESEAAITHNATSGLLTK